MLAGLPADLQVRQSFPSTYYQCMKNPPLADRPLAGSSSTNPWILRSDGSLLSPVKRSPSPSPPRKTRLKSNKTRAFGYSLELPGRKRYLALSPRRSSLVGSPVKRKRGDPFRTIHKQLAEDMKSSARTTIIYRDGRRINRERPLSASDLYLDDERPEKIKATAGHRCILCRRVKSHPVAHPKCGHSYCYVCVRLHLEVEWTCPYREADSLAADYPNRVDNSRVSYSWAGLTFPMRPPSIWVGSSP
ncbi:hypothetical protein R3P38DRAFT_3547994 [Favolaschia claudopus]|uniref:RING-type domain-containing protein n=1 Tax=Favolaschia claudopus TaxID=2862362 RepID=A0AAW0B5S3_9AGAR